MNPLKVFRVIVRSRGASGLPEDKALYIESRSMKDAKKTARNIVNPDTERIVTITRE